MHATQPRKTEKAMVITPNNRLQFAKMARAIPRGRSIPSKARYSRKEGRAVPADY